MSASSIAWMALVADWVRTGVVMNKVAMVPLAVGVVVGGLAIKLGLDTLQEAKASGKTEVVQAVVAVAEIPVTYEITPEMVKIVDTPKTPLLGTDGYSMSKDVIGRVVYATIPAGAAIRESLLAPEGTPPGLRVRIEQGYRAVSVKIDEVSGVAYQLQPGAFVDVFAVMTANRSGSKKSTSRLVLQKVEVGAIGRTLSSGGGSKSKAAKSVTLLVQDKDVPKLHLAQVRGKLTFALRGADDNTLVDVEDDEDELLAAKAAAEPAPAPERTVAPEVSTEFTVLVRNGGASSEYAFVDRDSMRMQDSRRRPPRRRSGGGIQRSSARDHGDHDDEPDDEDESDGGGGLPLPPAPPG